MVLHAEFAKYLAGLLAKHLSGESFCAISIAGETTALRR
jgi:hypothetical protein